MHLGRRSILAGSYRVLQRIRLVSNSTGRRPHFWLCTLAPELCPTTEFTPCINEGKDGKSQNHSTLVQVRVSLSSIARSWLAAGAHSSMYLNTCPARSNCRPFTITHQPRSASRACYRFADITHRTNPHVQHAHHTKASLARPPSIRPSAHRSHTRLSSSMDRVLPRRLLATTAGR